ncbi:MAG: acetyltransferase, partial [Paludibacteraceae bacterium]|nr:acetyltransferase [Paludibacteraceae bacterium]
MRFLSFLARLPWGVMYAISDFLYLIMYYVVRYRRGVVAKNLRNSFPEKTDAELKVIEKKFYRHFADLFVEILKLMRITPQEYQRRVRFLD